MEETITSHEDPINQHSNGQRVCVCANLGATAKRYITCGGIRCHILGNLVENLVKNYKYIQLPGEVQVLCVHLLVQMGRGSELEVYEWFYEVERGPRGPTLHVLHDAVDMFRRPWKVLKKVFGTGFVACLELLELTYWVVTN